MGKGMKTTSSDRAMRSSEARNRARSDTEDTNKSQKKAQQKKELVYAQTSLQAIDNAPEPNQTSNIGRHAVSAADILNQSTVSNDGNASKSEFGNVSRQSFTLQGSASSLLVKGGNGPRVRRNTEAPAAGSTASPHSTKGSVSSIVKRSIYAPKDLQDSLKSLQNLDSQHNTDDGGDESAAMVVAKGNNNDISSDSSDSYDANVLPFGDASETSQRRRQKFSKQTSSLSGGPTGGYLGSVADLSHVESDDFDDEDDFHGSVSTFDEDEGPVTCCGFHAPQLRLPVNRIASALVRYAPCFWCFPIPVSATDRTVLTRLNIISAFFALGQIVATAWLVIVMLIPPVESTQEEEYALTHGMAPNLWSLTGSMYSIGFFGAVIFVTNLVTLKVIQVVNLVGAIRYLWVLLYLLPFEIFFVLSIIDPYNVTDVWIKHWWRVPSMAWFREVYCAPGTANSLCMVPIFGENSTVTEDDWCKLNYQATNCTEIRNTAQEEVSYLLSWFYNSNVAWGVALVMVLFLIVNTLERIISRPMVQKSRESNVPAWLSLPFLGCSIVGAVFRYSDSSVLSEQAGSQFSWIGTAFMACGALFFISAILAWFISTFSILSGRDKRYKHMSVILFIFLMGFTSFVLTIIFVASVAASVSLVEIEITDDQKGTIACGVDTADSCSNCDGYYPDAPKCPEWTLDDVTRVLQNQTKGSATLAIIFFLYSFSTLRFGFVLRKHVTMYQIDYV